MAPKVKKVGDLVQLGRELEVMERPEKELKKFEGRRKLLRKMIGKEGGGNMKKMTPKLQKKMEEIMEELGMMSPRVKPVKKKDGGLAAAIEKVKKEDAVKMKEGGDPTKKLVGGQKKLDKNKDGRISGEDFKLLRAEPMKLGGVVKMGAGGGVCKGMGIARAGGKFKLR